MVTVLVKVRSAVPVMILSVPASKVTGSAIVKSEVAEPRVSIKLPRSMDLIEIALAVVNVLDAATVTVVVAALVVNVPAMSTLAPITSDPPAKSRVVPTGIVIVSLAVNAALTSSVPVPEVVMGCAAGTVKALDTVNTALPAKTILLSLARVRVDMVALASTSILPATRSAPVTETLEMVAPAPFNVKTLDALPKTMAFVFERFPCPVKLRVAAGIEIDAPE